MNTNFPGGSDGKASAYNAGDPGSIPGQEDLLEKGKATHSSILASPRSTQKRGSKKHLGAVENCKLGHTTVANHMQIL